MAGRCQSALQESSVPASLFNKEMRKDNLFKVTKQTMPEPGWEISSFSMQWLLVKIKSLLCYRAGCSRSERHQEFSGTGCLCGETAHGMGRCKNSGQTAASGSVVICLMPEDRRLSGWMTCFILTLLQSAEPAAGSQDCPENPADCPKCLVVCVEKELSFWKSTLYEGSRGWLTPEILPHQGRKWPSFCGVIQEWTVKPKLNILVKLQAGLVDSCASTPGRVLSFQMHSRRLLPQPQWVQLALLKVTESSTLPDNSCCVHG